MELKHFSHEHPLIVNRIQRGQQQPPRLCHGCRLPCNDSAYSCNPCNFFLHQHCGNASRYLNHPTHGAHPLVLVPTPTYHSGSFVCNGCGAPGTSFSYCCPICEVDLHVNCALLRQKSGSQSHHHELTLCFGPLPAGRAGPDYCRACRKEMDTRNNWFYFCERAECDFRVHTFCATGEGTPAAAVGNVQAAVGNAPAAEREWTQEEMALEVARMKMEYDMNQALCNIIAYYPNRRYDY